MFYILSCVTNRGLDDCQGPRTPGTNPPVPPRPLPSPIPGELPGPIPWIPGIRTDTITTR